MMEQRRSSTSLIQRLVQEYNRRRDLRTLTRGLRRLQSWKSLLQELMKQVRLRATESPLETSLPLEIPKLDLTFFLAQTTLVWALATLEDLYLLVLNLEGQTETMMRELSKPR